MPTPSGLLKAGDVLEHASTGFRVVVVKREGNNKLDYSCVVRNLDGSLSNKPTPFGYTADHWYFTEVHYYVEMTHAWKVLSPAVARHALVRAAILSVLDSPLTLAEIGNSTHWQTSSASYVNHLEWLCEQGKVQKGKKPNGATVYQKKQP